jgi:hypothetical protein
MIEVEISDRKLDNLKGSHPQLLLVNLSACPAKVRTWAVSRHDEWQWVFLSNDYLKLKQWKKDLGDSFSYIHINRELELSAQRLKKPYLKWIAQLGHNHPEAAWWASRVSERNTAVSQLFEDVCRLDSLRSLLKGVDRPVMIVADNSALMKAIRQADWLKDRKQFQPMSLKFSSWPSMDFVRRFLLFSRFSLPIIFMLRTVQLLKQVIQAKIAMSRTLPINCANIVLIHTYIDENNLSTDYTFHDRYFPGLAEILKNKGFEVLFLPVMYSVKRSYWSAWTWTKSSTTRFINPFKFYHCADYFFAFRTAYRVTRLPLGPLKFDGNDIECMVRQETRRYAFDSLTQILYIKLPLRLSEHGINCVALFAEFENMIPEKMLIHGFRKYQPTAELIGFQHGAFYPNFLCIYTPVEERDIAPMYDRVVCNGSLLRNVLVAEGLSPDIAVVGAALRYKHLWAQFDLSESVNQVKSIDIFVPLPLMISAGVELLDKLLAAFSLDTTLRVLLKPHPMSTIEVLMSRAGVESLPPHFQTTNDSISEILVRTHLMVGLSTSTMLEAVAAGVPVVRVNRETALDLDPLAFLENYFPPCHSAAEMSIEVQRLLKLSNFERNKLYQTSIENLEDMFHPCDEVGLEAFLPKRKSNHE